MAIPRSIKNSSCDTTSEDHRARLPFCPETVLTGVTPLERADTVLIQAAVGKALG